MIAAARACYHPLVTDSEALFVRLPSDLVRRIKESAAGNERTLTAEVGIALREYLDVTSMEDHTFAPGDESGQWCGVCRRRRWRHPVAENLMVERIDGDPRNNDIENVRVRPKPKKAEQIDVCLHPKSSRQSVAGGAAFICRDCGFSR